MQFLRSISTANLPTKEYPSVLQPASGWKRVIADDQTRLAASRVSSRLGASVRVKRKSAQCQFDVTEAPNLTETEKFARLERIRSYATPHVHAYNLARASSVFCCKRLDSPGLILMTYEVKPNDQAAPPSYERGPPLVNADYPRASRAALPRQIE
jgi:hypothetical protein